MPLIEMIEQSIGDFAANLLFGVIILTSFAIAILCVMFFLLTVRAAWRRLTRGSWNDVVRSGERRAFLIGKAKE